VTPQPVEWVLAIYYGPSAHRATYGRLANTKYTKDYIQLSKKADFLSTISRLFPVSGGSGSFSLTYHWPAGSTPGAIVFNSSDRPHLKWETALGAPRAWRMLPVPTVTSVETIPGNPTHTDFDAAENELASLSANGAGQPYLLAVKLRDEPSRLHLRVYLKQPLTSFAWADIGLVPAEIQKLASRTSQSSALAWDNLPSGGAPPSAFVHDTLARLLTSDDSTSVINALDSAKARALANYLRQPGYGLFFDPTKNHDAWSQPTPLSEKVASSAPNFLSALDTRFPPITDGDMASEALVGDPDEIETFRQQITQGSFEVPDAMVMAKTRGSAQKAFADKVKSNYGFRCAIAGIGTREFLVAAHIVPWSQDQTIRLDPANGICLSLIVDRAFERGFVLIEDDLTVRLDRDRIGGDPALLSQLEQFDGRKLSVPEYGAPKAEYLQRRRALVVSAVNSLGFSGDSVI
jgi:HNH endonuclease